MMIKTLKPILLFSLLFSTSAMAAMVDHSAIPPTISSSADPNVLINLSIETPMQGAAYNDQDDTASGGSCSGRPSAQVGTCYFPTQEYIGYFDPDKCYTYSSNRFEPAGPTGADHTCSGEWSGNLLNWATMTATDEFRWALTGGNRVADDPGATPLTVLERGNMGLTMPADWFPDKRINSTDNVAPSTVTPYSDSTIWIRSHGVQIDVGTSQGGSDRANDYNVQVVVCDASVSTEDNCVMYTDGTDTWYKPEGLIQNNALRMRFAVMSYMMNETDNSTAPLRAINQARDGGVLRANMKYTGPTRPATGGGIEDNENKEWGTDGVQMTYTDPDGLASGDADINFSGVINYINKFGANGYKSYDPIGELYYECLNYFKKRGPTAEYSSGLTAAMKDNFPVINGSSYASSDITGNTDWIDPIIHRCQNNYIVGINDANPWLDKTLPGTHWTLTNLDSATGSPYLGDDYGEPSNPDTDINVTTLTGIVGDLQNITGTSQCVGGDDSTWDNSETDKTIASLGTVMGTCPWVPKQNSYYIAGLAYYARTNDLRADHTGDQTIETFLIDTQEYSNNPLTGQMNMLWLAGKYGGFEEQDDTDNNSDGNTNEPNLAAEWDEDGDGVPDNYVLANDPVKLVNGLGRAFSNIVQRVSAGSAAAVISNSTSGTGTIIQALYQPRVDINGKQIQWAGRLHSVFLDEKNHLREDTNQNRQLDNYATDKVIKILYDSSVGRTRVFICDTGDGITVTCDPTDASKVKEIDELNTLWDARDQLAAISDANIVTQRTYGTADGKRYILTWLDDGNAGAADNGQVDSSEVKNFVAASFNNADEYSQFYLPATGVGADGDSTLSSADAALLVNYIRGKEGITGFRSRSIDYDNDATDEAWRLGDIIHSTPVALEAPTGDWDIKYGDTSYAAFRSQYAKRRQVVYVGANDGMLHAFNGGFLDPLTKTYNLTRTQATHESGAPASHALGSELWAYVPKNLLPHLQWLKEINYPHVYYVDGNVQTFDVNIFPTTGDTTHPNGWGTILVATMRFGGNPINYDHDNSNGTADITTGSSVMIFDVTDPELAPKLLGEFTDSALGFTTNDPTLIYDRAPDINGSWTTPDANEWTLAFGSGPNDLAEAKSTQNPHLYGLKLDYAATPGALDLTTAANIIKLDLTDTSSSDFNGGDSTDTTSFVGHPLAVDWDNDYVTDTVYFGLVKDDIANQTGKLKRFAFRPLDTPVLSDLIDQGQPFPNKPEIVRNAEGQWWVHVGTGRLYVNADNVTNVQQSYYGVKEDVDAAKGVNTTPTPYDQSDLVDTGGITVTSGGTLGGTGIPSGVTTFNGLVAHMNQTTVHGWYKDFLLSNPNERNLSGTTIFDDMLLFTTYKPPTDACLPEGSSSLYALFYKTGTAHPSKGLVQANDVFNTNSGVGAPVSQVNLGLGLAAKPVMYRGIGAARARPIIQTSTGEIVEGFEFQGSAVRGRESWREIFTD